MKLFNFKRRRKEPTPPANLTHTERKRKTYMVALFWYNTKNITNQMVSAYTPTGAKEIIRMLFDKEKLNETYGIVSIIEM